MTDILTERTCGRFDEPGSHFSCLPSSTKLVNMGTSSKTITSESDENNDDGESDGTVDYDAIPQERPSSSEVSSDWEMSFEADINKSSVSPNIDQNSVSVVSDINMKCDKDSSKPSVNLDNESNHVSEGNPTPMTLPVDDTETNAMKLPSFEKSPTMVNPVPTCNTKTGSSRRKSKPRKVIKNHTYMCSVEDFSEEYPLVQEYQIYDNGHVTPLMMLKSEEAENVKVTSQAFPETEPREYKLVPNGIENFNLANMGKHIDQNKTIDISEIVRKAKQDHDNAKLVPCQKPPNYFINPKLWEDEVDEMDPEKQALKKAVDAGPPYICWQEGCGRTLANPRMLKRHQRCHNVPSLKCTVDNCGKKFKHKDYLDRHIKSVHEQVRSDKDSTLYQCHLCGTYLRRISYQRHMRKQHGSVANFEYKCEFQGCGLKFTCYRKLMEHSPSHKDEKRQIKKYVCPYEGCEKRFSDNKSLTFHINVHTGEKPYKCSYPDCNKAYKQKPHLYFHIKAVHKTAPIPLENLCCQFCHQQFQRQCTLTVHLQKHCKVMFPALAERKKHPCEKCGQIFYRLRNLLTHMRKKCKGVAIVPPPSLDQPPLKEIRRREYCCMMCGKTFTWERNLIAHVKHGKYCSASESTLYNYRKQKINGDHADSSELGEASDESSEPFPSELANSHLPNKMETSRVMESCHKLEPTESTLPAPGASQNENSSLGFERTVIKSGPVDENVSPTQDRSMDHKSDAIGSETALPSSGPLAMVKTKSESSGNADVI